jgi:hypothetical protein
MSDEGLKDIKEVKEMLRKLTDVHLSRKELAAKWGVTTVTIDNYRDFHGLPQLKNGKYSYGICNDWLYESNISKTQEGKKILKAITPK